MNRTMRCDCKLNGLLAAQRVKVEVWLFEEGWTYEGVVEGCLREFGFKVSKSSVGRYYERESADRFAKVQWEKRQALEPELSPAEAYKELLRRIAVLAWEEMDQPLKDINHKVVVRLVRVLIAARREKHQETRVSVERRKAENLMAKKCLMYMREQMRKRAYPMYLPMGAEGPKREKGGWRNVRAPLKRGWLENCESSMDNTLAETLKTEKSVRGNTHESTIGLQSGKNSFTKFGTQIVKNINHR